MPSATDIPRLLVALAAGEADQGRPALSFYRGRTPAGRLALGELLQRIDAVAAHLAARFAVGRGDRVALLSRNRLEVPVLMLALMRLGAGVVPLNPTSMAEERAYVAGHAGVRGLLATRDFLGEAGGGLDFAIAIEDLWADAAPASPPPGADDLAGDLAVVLYTSGTTGRPKGVALSQKNLLANAASMAANFGLDRTTQLAVLPLYHAHAFGFGMMTALLTGGHLVFMERFDPFAWAEVIRAERVEVTSVVPSLIPPLLDVRARRESVPTLRCVLVSSAPLTGAVARRFDEEIGLPLVQGWGLSEYTNFACCVRPDAPREDLIHLAFDEEVPSIGGALPGVEVTVRDAEGGVLGEGARGELWIRGPSTMIGYFRDEPATAAALASGWLRSGDEGFYRVRGGEPVFFVTGRIKEIIIRGADKYSPLAIERLLAARVPELSGSIAVLGFPHAVHGEEVGAYVEQASLPPETEERLRLAIASIPVEQRPKVVLHGAEPIPRTHTGKVQRRKLGPLFAPYRDCRGALRVVAVGPPDPGDPGA